ncbi:unnamed protein product, partial [Brachionus calyciflorus]
MDQQQVIKPVKLDVSFEGIKGFCHLSYWISILDDDIIYDYMHMCLLAHLEKSLMGFSIQITDKNLIMK